MSKNLSISEIRDCYASAPDTDFYKYSLARHFFRPLSFYGSWLFIRLGLSPNQTTLLSWVSAIIGCFFLTYGGTKWSLLGTALLLLWALLDYMDGSMARALNVRSAYGHFIDVVGAYLVIAFWPLCMAIGLSSHPEGNLDSIVMWVFPGKSYHLNIILIGALSSLSSILLRLILTKGEVVFGAGGRTILDAGTSTLSSFMKWVEALMSPRGIFFPLMIIAAWYSQLELFVFVYFVYNCLSLFGLSGLYTFQRYRESLG